MAWLPPRFKPQRQGYTPEDVLRHMEQMVRPLTYSRILVAEPDPGMREILVAEIRDHVNLPVEAVDHLDVPAIPESGRCVMVAFSTRLAQARRNFATGVPCIPLRLRSVRGSLQGKRGRPRTL